MAMTLGYLTCAIAAFHRRSATYNAGICAEAQCASLVHIVTLSGHEVNDLMRAELVELAGIGIGNTEDIACVFNNGDLHTEADTEVRQSVLAGKPCRTNHTLNAASAEAAGNYDTVKPAEQLVRICVTQRLGIYPLDIDLCSERIARMTQRLGNREICVVQRDVFADKSDSDLPLGRLYVVDH